MDKVIPIYPLVFIREVGEGGYYETGYQTTSHALRIRDKHTTIQHAKLHSFKFKATAD